MAGIRCGDQFHPLECQSTRIKRVCRSTLTAEANALVEAAESLDFIRLVIKQILTNSTVAALRDPDPGIRMAWYIDAQSLFDVIVKDTGAPVSDKRVRVVIAQLRELREEQ